MKKSLILVGMLSIGYAYAQEGAVGINTEEPKATLHIQPSSDNLTKTTNEGIIAPKLTKERIANIATPVEGTLVYATDNIYGGNDAKVAKITEKGYYFYNGTEWVKTSATDGGEWKFDGVDAIVAKRANETAAQDLIQIKNGKGLQQLIGSPDVSALTYKGYNSVSGQVENRTIFKPSADLKSVPNFKYITSDALADTSIFEEPHRPNNRIFTSDYKLFQFKPSHLDKVTTGQATYVPYYRVAHFNNLNKNLFDIWLNRDQLFIGDNNAGNFAHIGGHEIATTISGTNTIGETRGIDTSLQLTGSNTINVISGVRNIIENTYGFTGKIGNLYGSRNIINFREGGNINEVLGAQVHIETPATSNANMANVYANVSGIKYHSQNTTNVGNIISNRIDTQVNTAASTKVVQAINTHINSKSEVTNSLTSAWFANTYENKNASSPELTRMDGVVVSNNYIASSPVKYYSGVVVHNKVSQEATGNIVAINGININNELVDGATSEVTDNYGIYINDIKGATRNNHAIHTGAGQIRFGDLKGTGDRVVYADSNGVLKTGASIAANNGVQNETTMECNDANRGKMNFVKDVTLAGGGTADAFAVCLKGSDGNHYWRYLYGAGGETTSSGNFGTGL